MQIWAKMFAPARIILPPQKMGGAHGPMGPLAHGPMGPWNHGPMGPMGPWAQWAHGPMGPTHCCRRMILAGAKILAKFSILLMFHVFFIVFHDNI